MSINLFSSGQAENAHYLVGEWFDAYHSELYRYITRLTGDPETAHDLLQETFIRAMSALKRQEPPSIPLAWLYRIASNVTWTALKRANRWRWLPFNEEPATNSFEHNVVVAATVRQALARLKPQDAELLLLYEYVGLSCGDIAQLTGDEVGTVRVRLYRARERFRNVYQGEERHEV